MGYTVEGGGTIIVRAHEEARALDALKAWAETHGQVGYAGHDQADSIANATSVADVFAQFGGMDVTESGVPGHFEVAHGDSWDEDYAEAARIIGPYCEPSTLEWVGEEGEHWRWRFTGTEMREEQGQVVYDDDTPETPAPPDVEQARRWKYLAAAMSANGDTLGDETDGTELHLKRYALAETNVGGSSPPRYYTTHESWDAAASYSLGQEYASDWHATEIIDLDDGTATEIDTVVFSGARLVTRGEPRPIEEPLEADDSDALDAIATMLREADWSDLPIRDTETAELVEAIHALLKLHGRDAGPADGTLQP